MTEFATTARGFRIGSPRRANARGGSAYGARDA